MESYGNRKPQFVQHCIGRFTHRDSCACKILVQNCLSKHFPIKSNKMLPVLPFIGCRTKIEIYAERLIKFRPIQFTKFCCKL